jgi:hypothetical protein
MQKRMRGLENVEKRLRAMERRLDKLEGKGAAGTRKRTTPKSTTPKSTTPESTTPESTES